jgi:hypothetical protein
MSTYISTPCEFCHAEAGQPCDESCLSYQAGEYDAWPETEVRPLAESLSLLAASVHRLPYGNLVGVRGMGAPDRADYSTEEYFAALADWMAEYEAVLRAEVDALQAQSKRAITLELEREVVRNFFGKVT